jgi:MFS family permease
MRSYLPLVLVGSLETFAFSVIHPILPFYVEGFGVSYEKVGLVFSVYSFTWAVLQIYTGYLADVFGRKRVALVGFALYSAFAFLNYTAKSFSQLLVFRIIQGVGLGLLGPSVLGLVGEFEEKGKSFAFYRAANGAGGVLGPAIGGLIGSVSLGHPFLLSAIASSLAGVATLMISGGKAGGAKAGFFGVTSGLLRNRAFLLICAACFLAELGYASFGIAIPLAGRRLAFSTSQIGLVFSSYSLSFTCFQVPVGIYAERAGKRRVVVGASFLSSLFFLGLFLAGGFLPMAIFMAFLGITLGAIYVQATALAAEMASEEEMAMHLAFFDSVIDFSFIAMPLFVGFVAGFGENLPFLFCAIFLAGAGMLFGIQRIFGK